MFPFRFLFPEIAEQQFPVLNVLDHPDLPIGIYAFDEYYCANPACDCQEVLIYAYRSSEGSKPELMAVINHHFDVRTDHDQGPTHLEPVTVQLPWAEEVMELFRAEALEDPVFVARLVHHYEMVKEAAADPNHPMQQYLQQARDDKQRTDQGGRGGPRGRLGRRPGGRLRGSVGGSAGGSAGGSVRSPIRAAPKIGRNASCPCGSGRKFKQCCLAKEGAMARTDPAGRTL